MNLPVCTVYAVLLISRLSPCLFYAQTLVVLAVASLEKSLQPLAQQMRDGERPPLRKVGGLCAGAVAACKSCKAGVDLLTSRNCMHSNFQSRLQLSRSKAKIMNW